MREVLAAAAEADGVDPVDESVHLRLKHQGLSGTDAWTDGRDGVALRHDGSVDLVVRPGARGRGVGSGLATQALAAPGEVTAWSHGHHPAAVRLAEKHGLARVRDLWVMRRAMTGTTDPGTTGPSTTDHGAEPLPALAPAPGVRLGHWGDGWGDGWAPDREAEADALLRVNAAAFAHHPEQAAMDTADLRARMAEDWFDPAGLVLGLDEASGELLGFHWTKQHSPALGEVYVVGIAPQAQGRGLGRTLTLAGLHHLADRGVAEVLLYVESDNDAAVRVYSGLGFIHADVDTHVMYRRPPS